ncbi:MAG: hydroxylamine reductase [Thiomargarita sp.]|nr:hydroxylamine reductase [Thiomargarita sp.]
MFCYQCEQTGRKGTTCTDIGVCGKNAETAALQDLTIYLAKGIANYLYRARKLKTTSFELDKILVESLFYTVTNVNFDTDFLVKNIAILKKKRQLARDLYESACKQSNVIAENLTGAAIFEPAEDLETLVNQAASISIKNKIDTLGEDVAGLHELLTYGLKGTASYAHHALAFGYESETFFAFLEQALDYLTTESSDTAYLLELSLKCGELNLTIMELLDKAHNDKLGHPEPTQVRITPIKGHCILVSGHDLHDLNSLLQATEGKGINIYTHGEMLPAHGYPKLKQYKHLVGNYGGAWQNQEKEFKAFPGSILMTTNCLQKPNESYKQRIFTTGLVGWSGVQHLPNGDWQSVIDAALEVPGFEEDDVEKNITVGFGHHAVLGLADKIISAVKSGAIRHFFVVGGCDGAKTGRNYYTELAQSIPNDCVILTLGCGKYRFNKKEFGDIAGIPRLLDLGQCNDTYSAIKIASALATAFKTEINQLPLSLMISWYEQKAVAVLLTLLHLGIKNIHLGPTLPNFITPNVLNILVEKFAIKANTTAKQDIELALS